MKNKTFFALGRELKEKLLRTAVVLRNGMADMKEDIQAMGTIEVVLIVAILVALALLFRGFISEYANKIFGNIEDKTDAAFQDW